MKHSAHRVKLWWKKLPNFLQNHSAFVRGWLTSGRWCCRSQWGQDTKNTQQVIGWTSGQYRPQVQPERGQDILDKEDHGSRRRIKEAISIPQHPKGGLDSTGTPAWTSQLSSCNWCHMIQKSHVTPTSTTFHPLTKADRFCRKFGNFSTMIWLIVQNVLSEIMFPESKNIHSQTKIHIFMSS